VAEFIGSFALTFIGAGAIMVTGGDLVAVALAHGVVLAVMVTALGHISGGHFNPAVTFGFVVTRRIQLDEAVRYWAGQFAGGIVAALLLRAVIDDGIVDQFNLGAPSIAEGTSVWQGFLVEVILTFLLVLVVFATAVDPHGAFKIVGGFAIGLTVGVDILMGGPLTGAAMNPQRALGPQLVAWFFEDDWVYYVAPPIGGALAALLYDRLYLRGAAAPLAGTVESGVDQPGLKRAAE